MDLVVAVGDLMRWHEPKFNDTRIKARFLLFPKMVRSQTRWLEYAKWKELYSADYGWIAVEWIN